MSIDELKKYYADLLILQYVGKPKAHATIEALVEPALMDNLPIAVRDAFTIGTAVGVQLDLIGKYVGVTRYGYTIRGPVTLNDNDFNLLIKMAILQNNSQSSLAEIQNLIFLFFPGALRVFDYQNMRLAYYLNSLIISADLAEVFINNNLLPKPMGVQLASVVYISHLTNIFGFRTYALASLTVSGFNEYSDYETDRPWLSYVDAIAS